MRNNSKMAEVMSKLAPLLDEEYIDMLACNSAWNIVLGVIPYEFKGYENQIMEENRKDTSSEKIDNIERITSLSKYLLEIKPDFSYENLELFSLAACQLIKYTSGDSKAENSLTPLKDLYISFVTSYYIESVKSGNVRSASKNIRHFSEMIFGEHDEIRTRLNEVIS